MIMIEINRWTIMKLEEAMEKYNKNKTNFIVHEYTDIINRILEKYLEEGI